jgi:hypothetical protein
MFCLYCHTTFLLRLEYFLVALALVLVFPSSAEFDVSQDDPFYPIALPARIYRTYY